MNKDEEHLKLLSIFHYIVGGLAGFFACFPIIHFCIGVLMLADASRGGPPVVLGLFFIMMSLTFIILGWALAICLIISGRYLALKERYKFCFAIACISCVLIPYGTVLGVFTIIVLMRPSVKELFAAT
jgi:hypothetical protein